MFGIIRSLFGRGDAEDERVLAYLEDRASEADSWHLEDSEDLESLRETVRMLRDVDDVEAPRSFAVNEENLSRQGYSRDEIERILNPSSSGIRIGIGSIPAYVPLILAGIAVLGVVLLMFDDITDFAIEDQGISGPSAPGLPGAPGEPRQPGAPAKAAPAATARPGIAAVGAEKEEEIIVQTVVVERVVEVERQVVQTVEVERVVEREVVHTVEVEREVMSEVVVETVAVETPLITAVAAEMSEVVVETVVVMEAVAAEMSEVVVETVVVREEVVFDAPDEVVDSMDVSPTETSTPSPMPSPTFTPVPTPTPIPTELPIPTATPDIAAFTSPSDVTVSEGSGRAAFGLQMWIIQVALILIAVLSFLVWAWMRLRR